MRVSARRTGPAALVLAGLLTGLVLAAAAAASNPLLLVLLPAGLLAALFAYRSPLQAAATALLLVPVGLVHLGGNLKAAQALDVLVVLALAAARFLRGRTPLPLARPLFWGGVLLVVALVSTGTSLDTGLALKQDLALAVGLALCTALVALCTDRARWLVLVRALLAGSVLVTLPALFSSGKLQARYSGSVVSDRPVGIFSQPNELGAFSMLALLIALGLLLGATQRRDRVLAAVALLSATGAMLVSLSRGAWIGSVVGVCCLLFWVPRARRLVAGATVAVAVLGALLGAFAPSSPQVQVVTQRLGSLTTSHQNPYDDRPRIWREALREISERPVLGEGPGTFPVASTRSISAAATVQADHAHDVLLTTGAETGLLGVAALLALTYTCATRARRGLSVVRRRGDALHLGVLGGLVASLGGLIGEGTVDVTLRNVVVAQTAWAALGLVLAGAALAVQEPQAEATACRAGVAEPS